MPRGADRVHITKSLINSLRSRDAEAGKDRWLWDSELRGFGLRIQGKSSPRYVVRYRHAGRVRRMAIGPVGSLTPKQARDQARQILSENLRGKDPLREREAERHRGLTVRELSKRYLEQHAEVHKKSSSVRADRLNLKKHIKPSLGHLTIAEVSRQHVYELHYKMRKTPTAANRVLALLSKMFNLAVLWELREDNPARGIRKYKETKRDRFLSAAELAALGKALRDAEAENVEWPPVVSLIRLLLFTGCRVGEITGLRWQHVDFKTGRIMIEDGKTGDRTIPMNAPARVVLAKLHTNRGTSPWVIQGRRKERPLVSYTRTWHRIRLRAELDGVRIHDLRHSNASVGAAAGLSLPVIGALLGNSSPITTNRYAHLADDPIREASDLVGNRISALMESDEHLSDVISIERKDQH